MNDRANIPDGQMAVGGFGKELEELLNRHSQENASNTPDFVLALYLRRCLDSFNLATQQRETWYGRDPRPSETQNKTDK